MKLGDNIISDNFDKTGVNLFPKFHLLPLPIQGVFNPLEMLQNYLQ